VRSQVSALLQTAAAATASYAIATYALGHEAPIFAAISAVIVLGAVRGQELRRAVEVTVGVVVGVTIADVLVLAIGTGIPQIALIVVLAMVVAVFVGAGPVLVTQAAISAILVSTVELPTGGLVPTRLFDTLVGGAVALLISQLMFPLDPVALIGRAARPVFSELGAALEETADALAAGDPAAAEEALYRARGIDESVRAFNDALQTGYETVRLAPPRRRARGHLDEYALAASQIDLAVRNTRVLARVAISVVRNNKPPPDRIVDAVRRLADAVRSLDRQLDVSGDEEANTDRTRQLALEAVRLVADLIERPEVVALGSLVAQVRLTSSDILRGSGMSLAGAHEALDEAAGLES
jgi:uncharacterized membrane protein YccC